MKGRHQQAQTKMNPEQQKALSERQRRQQVCGMAFELLKTRQNNNQPNVQVQECFRLAEAFNNHALLYLEGGK